MTRCCCSCSPSCGVNMTSTDDWTRLSWTTVWTTWVALAIIFLCGILKLTLFAWRRPYRSTKATGCTTLSEDKSGTGSAVSSSAFITDEDLAHVVDILNQGDSGVDVQWEEVVNKQSDTVAYTAKRRDPKDGGATEYLSTTVFENCSTKLVRDYYMDSDFRAEWDSSLVQHRQLDICTVTGTEVGLMVKKFPLLTPREYVLTWRLWEGNNETYYCVLKACEHKDAPKQSKYKRVEVYNSGWRIRKVTGREACEVKMIHQEDSGMKREMSKVAFRRGIWRYILKMDVHLQRYALRHNQLQNEVNAVSLVQKVPEALRERNIDAEWMSESTEDLTTCTSRRENDRPLLKFSGKRKLAKGLLLVGGALFFTQGSASLGAKIAAVCIMNRAMRPHGSSNFLQRIVDRV